MKNKLFGHIARKRSKVGRTPGEPYSYNDYDEENENESSYEDVKEEDFPRNDSRTSFGKDKQGPEGYEGKEHVKYKNPGFSSHHIKYPQDEPHMKSRVSKEESHEMEDDFHQSVPNQTHYSLEEKLKRARMKMDAPDQEEPDTLRGNMVHNVGYEGDKDTSGKEEMGPNEMQEPSKEHRKKMIIAVTRRKMNKKDKY